MPRRRLPNYLCTYRKRWGLSQSELGALLGVSGQSVSHYELDLRRPSLSLVLRCEIIFGIRAAEMFPSLYKALQEDLAVRALALETEFMGESDKASLKKLELVAGIPGRTTFIPDL